MCYSNLCKFIIYRELNRSLFFPILFYSIQFYFFFLLPYLITFNGCNGKSSRKEERIRKEYGGCCCCNSPSIYAHLKMANFYFIHKIKFANKLPMNNFGNFCNFSSFFFFCCIHKYEWIYWTIVCRCEICLLVCDINAAFRFIFAKTKKTKKRIE